MSNDQLVALGDELRAARRLKGLSMVALGALVGCHEQTIFRIERGTQEASWFLIEKIKKVLEVESKK